jgi:hypothetical protein
MQHALEFVGLLLPGTIALDPHANTAEDHLLTPSKVDAQLNNIAVLDRI